MSRKVPRLLLYYNPAAAGVRRGLEGKLEFLISECRARQVLLDVVRTEGPGSILESSDTMAGRGYDLVAAWGGDGTVNEVGNLAARLNLPLAILPGGTINLLARELGIPPGLRQAVQLLFNGRPRRIKAGRAGDRLFFAMAGVGFDAAVCRFLPALLKRGVGRLAYVLTGARLLATYDFPSITVQCDGVGFTGTQVVISNIPHYAGSFELSPLADLSAPSLDLCVLKSDSRLGYLRFVARLLMRRHTRWRELVYFKGWTFDAASSEPVPVQIDGDYFGMLPMQFEMVPDAVQVMVPPAAQ